MPPVAIDSLLHKVRAILGERAQGKKLTLKIEIDALAADVQGGPTRLQQALLNYATNAIKFAEQGFVTRRAVHEEESGAFSVVRFEVEDSGIGIAAEILPQLFGAFEQTDNSTPPKTAGKP